jgi:hypothetical protein
VSVHLAILLAGPIAVVGCGSPGDEAPPGTSTDASSNDGGSTIEGDALTGIDAPPDAGSDDAPPCSLQRTGPLAAHAVASGGFSGSEEQYFALYDTVCQVSSDCGAACVAAGGTEGSCVPNSVCAPGAPDDMSKCVPPAYWLYVSQALSESGMTSSAAILPLVEGDYHDALIFTDFHIDIPDRAAILGVQFEIRRNADDGLAVDDTVRIVQSEYPVGIDRSQSSLWPTELAYATYGGADDTWGLTWRPEDLRSPKFGISIAPRYTTSAGNDRAHIDSARVSVFYKTACDEASSAR